MANSRGKKNLAIEFRNNSLKMEPHKRSKENVRDILENLENEGDENE